MKEYAMYKGEECLAIGTIREIAKKMNVKKERYTFIPLQLIRKE